MSDVLTGVDTSNKEYKVTLVQTQANWQNTEDKTGLEKNMTLSGEPSSNGTATLTYAAEASGSGDTATKAGVTVEFGS